MSVVRVVKTRNYTIISNHHLQNENLSYKAKGLLTFMLSLPDWWDFSVHGLTAHAKDGDDSVRSAVKELEEEGYVHRTPMRNSSGKFTGYEYTIYEIPQSADVDNSAEYEPTEPCHANEYHWEEDKAGNATSNMTDSQHPTAAKSLTENPSTSVSSQADPLREKPTTNLLQQLNTIETNTIELNTLGINTLGINTFSFPGVKKHGEGDVGKAGTTDAESASAIASAVTTISANTQSTAQLITPLGRYQNVLLTPSQLAELKAEFPADWQEKIENLSSYMASTNKSYGNHLATIRRWAANSKQQARSNAPEKRDYSYDPSEVL